MIKKDKPEFLDDQIRSLQWAIGELVKQKVSLEEKINSSRKTQETEEIIAEVLAQRDAMDKRIKALNEGLKKSIESKKSGSTKELQGEMLEIEGKLEVAQERLKFLEQDKYIEDLGGRLSGKEIPENGESEEIETELPESILPETLQENLNESQNEPKSEGSYTTKTDAMPETTNRISLDETQTDSTTETSTKTVPVQSERIISGNSISCTQSTSRSIREVAEALDLAPEDVLDKGMQAILRMISRNGNRITFPLDVKQVESVG